MKGRQIKIESEKNIHLNYTMDSETNEKTKYGVVLYNSDRIAFILNIFFTRCVIHNLFRFRL